MNKTKQWEDPVSIILPAYNEEKCILSSLKALTAFCKDLFDDFEIICVDDGSTDRTGDLALAVSDDLYVKTLRLPKNYGKGYAVRQGMRHARGRYLFFTDADLPYSLDALAISLKHFNTQKCDVVAGARDLPDSSDWLKSGRMRWGISQVFSLLTGSLLGVDVRDSQCGFKGFTDTAAQSIFSRIQISGYAFDVEIFALARALNLKVCKIPVRRVRHGDSKIRLTRDPFCMFLDILKIAKKIKDSPQRRGGS
ncbi:glycosyltransferase [Thermodesulfobacteriota bacterium]